MDVISALDGDTRALLQRYAFDPQAFETFIMRLSEGGDPFDAGRLRLPVAPPPPESTPILPEIGTARWGELRDRGLAALRRGEVGVVVLCGGMATRFSGMVKATAEALPGASFLDLKLADAHAAAVQAGGSVPVYLMTSFATESEVRAHLAARHSAPSLQQARSERPATIEIFPQSISLRLTESGKLFHTPDGKPSPYAPGHGDLPEALQRAGILQRFKAGGGTTLVMSNVDNLAATLDPVLIGAHLLSSAPITVEVTDKLPGDQGGAPALVDGRVQIVEAFRFPKNFDQNQIPVFSTNTMLFDVAVLEKPPQLTWFAVKKEVGGQTAVQFERLIGELTAFHESQFVRVPRTGLASRFEPAKDPEELTVRRPAIRAVLEARDILRHA